MNIGAISYNQLSAAFTEVNVGLLKRPVVRGSITDLLCWVRTEAKAATIKFPVRFFSNRAKRRGPYEGVGHTPPELVNFSAAMEQWGPDGEMVPYGTTLVDLYNLLQAETAPMLIQAANEYDAHLAAFLGHGHQSTVQVTEDGVEAGGATEYDTLPYFHTAKRSNPNRVLATNNTFSNYDGALKLDRAGLIRAFQHLDGVPGPDGRPLRMPGKIVVVVSNEDQFDRADVLLNGRLRGEAIGAGAAQVPNSTYNGVEGGEGGGIFGRAALLKLPNLNDYDGGKGWYAFKLAGAEHRPMTANIVQPPQMYINGLSPNDSERISHDLVRYGWRGIWGIGYAWSQLAFKGVEP